MYVNPFNDSLVIPQDTLLELMKNEGEVQIEAQRASREIGGPAFWCMQLESVIDRKEKTCGKHCASYQPRNGKCGICSHWSHVFVRTGETEVLRLEEPITQEILLYQEKHGRWPGQNEKICSLINPPLIPGLPHQATKSA
ncbi:MAG: hypothetical protein AAFR61_15240 [Bacteroidota bacterium]